MNTGSQKYVHQCGYWYHRGVQRGLERLDAPKRSGGMHFDGLTGKPLAISMELYFEVS